MVLISFNSFKQIISYDRTKLKKVGNFMLSHGWLSQAWSHFTCSIASNWMHGSKRHASFAMVSDWADFDWQIWLCMQCSFQLFYVLIFKLNVSGMKIRNTSIATYMLDVCTCTCMCVVAIHIDMYSTYNGSYMCTHIKSCGNYVSLMPGLILIYSDRIVKLSIT